MSDIASHHLLKRLWQDYIKQYRRRVVIAVLCMMVAAAATACNAWLLQPALDHIFVNKDQSMLMVIPLALIAIAIVNGAADYGQNISMRILGQRVIADMQKQLFEHAMRADLAMFHDTASGRLISRFTNDIQMMRGAVSSVLTGLAKDSLTAVFLIGVMIYQSWQLSLFALLLFPITIYPILNLGRRMRKISGHTQEELGNLTAQLDETFQGVRIVKAYAQEEFEVNRANSVIEKLYKLYVKSARVQVLASPLMESVATCAIAGVIWYGGMQVIESHTTPGAFFSFVAAMIMAYRPMKSLANLNNQLQEGLAAAARLFAVLDDTPKVQESPTAQTLQLGQGAVAFKEVTFSYLSNDQIGLHHVSLHVPAGKTVALVGPSGAGKSTIMHLLLRFYDINAGRIEIDGQDIRNVTLKSLRQNMALVSQDTVLFDDSVANNIAYGTPDATREEIVAAAKKAYADEFIDTMPQGYETLIGPHGVKLSGGQRQRLSIARAILKNAPILLLDEATSALDTASEKMVQYALGELMQHRTTLVIAHRLSTIMHADKICVLDKGQVVEEGTHQELLARGGLYAHLHQQQFANVSESAA